jgi:hypothetical protein
VLLARLIVRSDAGSAEAPGPRPVPRDRRELGFELRHARRRPA